MNPVKEWQKRISYMREVPSSFIRMFCHATKFKKHHYILLLRKFLLMRCFLRQGLDQIEEKLWHDQARTFEKLDGTLKLSSTKQQRLKIPSSFTEIQYFFLNLKTITCVCILNLQMSLLFGSFLLKYFSQVSSQGKIFVYVFCVLSQDTEYMNENFAL